MAPGRPSRGAPAATLRAVSARPIHAALAVLVAALAAPPAAAAQGGVTSAAMGDTVAAPATDFDRFLTEFLAQRPDDGRVAAVRGVTLERDAGRFVLEEGELRLATPVGGRVCAAVFTGRGTFSLTPPLAGERDQMRRVYGVETMERRFRALVLIAADSTFVELGRRLAFAPGGPSKAAAGVLAECLRYVSDAKAGELKASLALPFLEGRADGYLFSLVDSESADRLFFEIDPRRTEEVVLWREPKDRHIGTWRVWRRDDVCMFPRGGLPDPAPEGDVRPRLAVRGWRVESRIAGNMDYAAVAEIELESRAGVPQHWAHLALYERLAVDSAAWVGGRAAPHFRGRESGQLWLRCDPPLAPGETRTLRVTYHGRLIERVGDWMLLGSSTGWYPEPDGAQRAPFELVFHHPSQYHLVSVGERVSSETRDRVTVSRWRSDRPIHNASFVLGLFDEQPFGLPDGPPVTALMFRGRPEPVEIRIGDLKIVSGARMDRAVAADAGRAAAFFADRLGPPPLTPIVVAEVPDTRGEAYPGLIQITWTAFGGRRMAAAEDAVFRAHEIAHQWWGYGVDHRTYRDHWLSEGFADFCGLWYLQAGLRDERGYLSVLHQWRERIFDDLILRPSGVPPPGPVGLGYRSASVETPGDHRLVVYKKGAWVLHMLRNLLLDLETGSDERFTALMRDFYARHESGLATTADFRRVAERYAGEDLGWFFDQWVHGTGLPVYRVAFRTGRTPEGKVRVTCRVEQTGVPADFRMPVPIRIELPDGRTGWVRVTVAGARTEVDLPPLDAEPTALRFNDLQSVLCRVEEVPW